MLLPLCLLLLRLPLQAAPAEGSPITWVSAGDAAGQALIVGMPLVPPTTATSSAAAAAQPTAAATALTAHLVHGRQKLTLAVLQQGNGSMMLGLPHGFTLAPWGLQLCTGSPCTAPVPIYTPDVMWTDCDGAACAGGGTLRVFGRRLAFDASGCRAYNSTSAIAGRELQLQLTPAATTTTTTTTRERGPATTTMAPVVLKATQQSCFDAAYALPIGLAPGTYRVSVANSVVAGHLSAFGPPTRGRQARPS